MIINDGYENYYYVWFKNIDKLDNVDVETHYTMYRCQYCLNKRFLTKERLYNHIENCKNNKSLIEEQLPEEGKNILFF